MLIYYEEKQRGEGVKVEPDIHFHESSKSLLWHPYWLAKST